MTKYVGATYTVAFRGKPRYYADIRSSSIYKSKTNEYRMEKSRICLRCFNPYFFRDHCQIPFQSVQSELSVTKYDERPGKQCWYPKTCDLILVFSYLNQDWSFRDASKWDNIGVAKVTGNKVEWILGKAIKVANKDGKCYKANKISFTKQSYDNNRTFEYFFLLKHNDDDENGGQILQYFVGRYFYSCAAYVEGGFRNKKEYSVNTACCFVIGNYPDLGVPKWIDITTGTAAEMDKFYENICTQ